MFVQTECGFERDSSLKAGFASANRVSSDAINALEDWKYKKNGRDYVIRQDDDSILRAKLTHDTGDHAASDELHQCCRDNGVRRQDKTNYLKSILDSSLKQGLFVKFTWGELSAGLPGTDEHQRMEALMKWAIDHGRVVTVGAEAGPTGYSPHTIVTIGQQ